MDDPHNIYSGWFYPTQPPHSPLKEPLNLQLMPNVTDRDHKPPFIPGRDSSLMFAANGHFYPRDYAVSEASIPMNYVRDGWMNQRGEKFVNIPISTPYGAMTEPPAAHQLQILQPPPPNAPVSDEGRMEEPAAFKEGAQLKKRLGPGADAPKAPKAKRARKPKDDSNPAVQRVKPPKKSMDVVIKGIQMDISSIPIPVCSCTGNAQQCYRWGCGGWQSACCTTNVSMYPLPMSTKRRGARIAGRKMSQGAFKKVLEKLAGEGYEFTSPIDLKSHWARHGTNKFVTIR